MGKGKRAMKHFWLGLNRSIREKKKKTGRGKRERYFRWRGGSVRKGEIRPTGPLLKAAHIHKFQGDRGRRGRGPIKLSVVEKYPEEFFQGKRRISKKHRGYLV